MNGGLKERKKGKRKGKISNKGMGVNRSEGKRKGKKEENDFRSNYAVASYLYNARTGNQN